MKKYNSYWKIAYIGAGSNLDKPIDQIHRSIEGLKKIKNTQFILSSSLYSSSPLGPEDQPDFINAVFAILTQLNPHELLNELQKIEKKQKRVRDEIRWGPRTIDLDILIYSNLVINNNALTLPHPEIQNRDFVLMPLAEIAPDLIVTDQKNVVDLLEKRKKFNLDVKKIINDE
jgi:2-amino-4-hydroxy-6-hydroxymethyldihydropteridine diphosphokinase